MAEQFVSVEDLKRKLIDEKHFYPAIVSAALKEMPEAGDYEKVIRCKNCVHYRPYPKPVEDFDGRCWIRGFETDEEEYCSYGTSEQR